MTPRARALSASLLLATCVGCRHAPGERPRGGALPAGQEREATPAPAARRRGAAPGDERGPGAFVARKEEKTFYPASGGQLWYYLNLYYWAPRGPDTKDLWLREEVVEEFGDLTTWPDGLRVPGPRPKTTVEYWEIGPTGRTMTIDNHKDFWLESANYSAGSIHVTMTLTLGNLQMKAAGREWKKPGTHYVLERKDYGPQAAIAKGALRFEPREDEPVNVWEYRIPWSAGAGRFLRSNWESLGVPTIQLVRSGATAPVPTRRATAEDR